MAGRRSVPELSPAERALFREAVADAVPLVSDKVHHEPPPMPAIVRRHECDEAAVLNDALWPQAAGLRLEDDGELTGLCVGLPRSLLKDLRRGRWLAQVEVDLHGLNRDEAYDTLMEVLAVCLVRGHRCLHIVHGKGRGAPGCEPVLKELVRRWLMHRPEVLGCCQASAADGGAGAVRVLLRARR